MACTVLYADDVSVTSAAVSLTQLIDGLQKPAAYPYPIETVDLVQTHISLVFLAGEFVYKVKKPVDFGFLDFTTLELRRSVCEAEVRLNRRLAASTYLGVVPIVRDSAGQLVFEGEGEALEWAVKMRRLPEERMFAHLLGEGEVDNRLMGELADLLTGFHAQARTGAGVDEHGASEAVRANALENFEALDRYAAKQRDGAGLWTAGTLAFLRSRAVEFLDSHGDLLQRRVDEGRIREGHGDLHAGNLCRTRDGIVAYDCIEFSPRFRCSDVAADLAFLAMDLDLRGYPAFGAFLVRRYAMQSSDPELPLLMDFYKGYRAMVRAKVAGLSSEDPDRGPEERERSRREASLYVQLGAGYELPPLLVLMCGLPACGKSWLAKRIVLPLRAALLRSDVRRKHLGSPESKPQDAEGYGQGRYSPQHKAAVYASLLEDVRRHLAAGQSVVLDATFGERATRAVFLDCARELSAPCIVVHVRASEDVTRERMDARLHDQHEPSDADWGVYLKAKEHFEAPHELTSDQIVEANSPSDRPELVGSMLIDRAIRQL